MGKALCPRCGSPDVYPMHPSLPDTWWECKKCGRTFPSPSYGPEEDFGKEARWFGKTTSNMHREEVRRTEKTTQNVRRQDKKWKKPRGGFSIRKFFLVILVIACILAAAYTGYLLFTDQTDPIVGTIILVVDIGVLIWNISVLRSYRVGFGRVFAIFLVTALVASTVCAFADVAPFSEVKDSVVGFFSGSDVKTQIMADEITKAGENYKVPIELTPSDSIELDKVNCVELLSSEGYSFGKEFVYWTAEDSREIKTVTFQIPGEDKVAREIEKLEQEIWPKLFSGEGPENTMRWYESSVNKILKVKITKIEELASVQRIYKRPGGSYEERFFGGQFHLVVELRPTEFVQADEYYVVQLWEKDKDSQRDSDWVIWSEAELNAMETKNACFTLAEHEWTFYPDGDLNHIFNVKIFPLAF
jgi:ribosomal protein L37AE/L43A